VELICAIDLLDGGAVRLVQGDYECRIAADADPASLARRFVAAGCRRLHVVDLAGARAGRPLQLPLLGEIVAAARAGASDVVVEAGGGLRSPADVDALLDGADEALLGTAAIEDAAFLRACAAAHPGRIAASLDLRDGRPALDGWSRTSEADAVALAQRLLADGASRLIVTDTGRDGTLAGPNLELMARLRAAIPDAVLVAAGGIGSIDDLRALDAVGCDGAVVGLALLTGAIDPEAAMAVLS
jgi:phosphoribosylformimino-5-aminoimidazole carboxamide ribotide isomerase